MSHVLSCSKFSFEFDLARIRLDDGRYIDEMMIAAGHAQPIYDSRRKIWWDSDWNRQPRQINNPEGLQGAAVMSTLGSVFLMVLPVLTVVLTALP